MIANPMFSPLAFLIKLVFDLYTLIILLRLILEWTFTHKSNPIMQFIYRVTSPIVEPISRKIPRIHGIDLATVTLLLVVQMVKITLIILLRAHSIPHFGGLLIWAFADILAQTLNIFFYSIIISAVLSWFNPPPGPALDIIYRITGPLLSPAQRMIPAISGIDISPIIVIVLLYLVTSFIVQPLLRIGITLALGVM